MQIDFGSAILPAVPSLYPSPPSMDECTKLYAPPEATTNHFDQVGYVCENDGLVL